MIKKLFFWLKENVLLAIIGLVTLIVLYIFFHHFQGNFSDKQDIWGAFGSYIGGTLSPLISIFAFHLIAKTYKLQKDELKETRNLLAQSTDAQKKQVKLATLTALINAKLMQIDGLANERMTYETEKSTLRNFRPSSDNTDRVKELDALIEPLKTKITAVKAEVTKLEEEMKKIGDL